MEAMEVIFGKTKNRELYFFDERFGES